MMRQFELVELVKSYDPNADEDALNRAYVYSMKAHGGSCGLRVIHISPIRSRSPASWRK